MIEKAIAASLEPLIDSLVATEKKQAALEARLADIQLKEGPAGRDGADGKDGVSLKGVSQEGAEVIFELSDGQELSVELPEGPQGPAGEQGEQGPAGENGKDADPVEVAKQAILLEEFTSVTTEAIKAMLAVRLQEEHDEVDAILN